MGPTGITQPPETERDGSNSAPNNKALGRTELMLFALASAAVTANGYYIHPIIARVGEAFGVSDAMIGMVPAFNQIALAVGIFFLLPLGDRMSNRRLATVFLAAQTLALVGMALAQDFWLFVTASTVLGFFTIVPYLLPAYVSKRVAPSRLGYATAILTTGIILGILVARVSAGVIGEHLGWRWVYWIAAAIMLAMTILVPRLMQDDSRMQEPTAPRQSYAGLLASIAPIARDNPQILISGAIQALGFGVFLSVWMGLGLHLTSDTMGYGVDTVGYLALLAGINLAITPRLGGWADRIGPYRARRILSVIQVLGVSLLLVFGHSLWLLIIPLLITSIAGPATDVTNRMTFLNEAPAVRTRLMTVYIMLMFTGGGLASWAGTAAYDWAGWTGNAVLAIAMSLCVLCLAFLPQPAQTPPDAP
ncbi:MAG: MFS transporter [Pseudomonadota bacterium]